MQLSQYSQIGKHTHTNKHTWMQEKKNTHSHPLSRTYSECYVINSHQLHTNIPAVAHTISLIHFHSCVSAFTVLIYCVNQTLTASHCTPPLLSSDTPINAASWHPVTSQYLPIPRGRGFTCSPSGNDGGWKNPLTVCWRAETHRALIPAHRRSVDGNEVENTALFWRQPRQQGQFGEYLTYFNISMTCLE